MSEKVRDRRRVNRIDRIDQMNFQEEVIARKRQEILEKQRTAELGKAVAAAQFSATTENPANQEEKYDGFGKQAEVEKKMLSHLSRSKDSKSVPEDDLIIENDTSITTTSVIRSATPKLQNTFCNDGSFLTHFQKILEQAKQEKAEKEELKLEPPQTLASPRQEDDNSSQSNSDVKPPTDENPDIQKQFIPPPPPPPAAPIQTHQQPTMSLPARQRSFPMHQNFPQQHSLQQSYQPVPQPLMQTLIPPPPPPPITVQPHSQHHLPQFPPLTSASLPQQFLSNMSAGPSLPFPVNSYSQFPPQTTGISQPTFMAPVAHVANASPNARLPPQPGRSYQTNQFFISAFPAQPMKAPTQMAEAPPPPLSQSIGPGAIFPLLQPQPKPQPQAQNPHQQNLPLNTIPKPQDLDLNAIPKPKLDVDAIKLPVPEKNIENVLSDNNDQFLLPTTVETLVDLVAEKGDVYEDKIRSRKNELHPALRFLFDQESEAYENYRQRVEDVRVEMFRSESEEEKKNDVDEKYDPESVCQYANDDDEDSDEEYMKDLKGRNFNSLKRKMREMEKHAEHSDGDEDDDNVVGDLIDRLEKNSDKRSRNDSDERDQQSGMINRIFRQFQQQTDLDSINCEQRRFDQQTEGGFDHRTPQTKCDQRKFEGDINQDDQLERTNVFKQQFKKQNYMHRTKEDHDFRIQKDLNRRFDLRGNHRGNFDLIDMEKDCRLDREFDERDRFAQLKDDGDISQDCEDDKCENDDRYQPCFAVERSLNAHDPEDHIHGDVDMWLHGDAFLRDPRRSGDCGSSAIPDSTLASSAGDAAERQRKRKSRWGGKVEVTEATSIKPISATVRTNFANQNKPLLSIIQRTDHALLQYARLNYGSTDLNEEEWRKCEEHFKVNLLYQDMMRKRQEIDQLARTGKFKYDYDSDEDTAGGTWEHKLRNAEMDATRLWADALTAQSQGKHHIGDFLPPEELKKFLEKYDAKKNNRQPDLSDYKEYKLTQDNIGFQMLQKLGWKEGQGLGADGSGIVDPVNKAPQRDSKQGLGAATPSVPEEGDNEYEAYRKRMMLAYRFRPNPLNNPRRAYY